MNTLLVLVALQLIGVGISVILFYCEYVRDKKKTFISNHSIQIGKGHSETWPWLIDYFQLHPESSLKHEFPRLYKIAMATKRYKELDILKRKGKLSEKSYEKKLRKILNLIDIKAELDVSEYKRE